MNFYLFGYQVHEKQILGPLMVFTLACFETGPWMTCFATLCQFSMFRLYRQDLQLVNYISLTVVLVIFGKPFEFGIMSLFSEKQSKLRDN